MRSSQLVGNEALAYSRSRGFSLKKYKLDSGQATNAYSPIVGQEALASKFKVLALASNLFPNSIWQEPKGSPPTLNIRTKRIIYLLPIHITSCTLPLPKIP